VNVRLHAQLHLYQKILTDSAVVIWPVLGIACKQVERVDDTVTLLSTYQYAV